jgi:hypothetical protein
MVEAITRCGGRLTPSRKFRAREETILGLNRVGDMRNIALGLSPIVLGVLIVAGGYYEFGKQGAMSAVGVISLILFAIWVDRTA